MKIRENLFNLMYTDQKDLWFRNNDATKLLVLLHGMYSTPSTFEDFAIQWSKSHPDWDVYCPALPAGCKDISVLKQLGPWTWDESLAVAQKKLDDASKAYKSIVLGGHSQGGSLSLAIAPFQNNLKALIIIASPLKLGGDSMSFMDNLGVFLSTPLSFIIPKGIVRTPKNLAERANVEKFCDCEGWVFPLTISTFKKGLVGVCKNLHAIDIPLFISYCKQDKLVPFENAEQLSRGVSSKLIVAKHFDIPKEVEPYGIKHQLLNYSPTKQELVKELNQFLNHF
ncbi:MAG: alpha/beta hydrolase [Brevinema sp.]